MHEQLDSFDRKILDLLTRDARRTGKELADEVGLSSASCLRRVQRLREIGAIEREVAVLSPAYSDKRVTILVRLQVARVGGDRLDKLRRKFRAMDEVEKIYHVTGDFDLVLVVAFPSMEDYARFTDAHFYAETIQGYDSMVVLSDLSAPLQNKAT